MSVNATSACRPGAVEPLEARRLLSAGDLDPTFGTDGMREIWLSTENVALAAQPDGKLIIAAVEAGPADSGGILHVLRLNSNGSDDSSFGNNGEYQLRLDRTGAADLALGSDAKITVVAGNRLVRLTATGRPDAAFGGGHGIVASPTDLTALALENGGSIVAGGGKVIRRFTAQGAIDSSFATGGAADLAAILPDPAYALQDVTIDSAGRYVLVFATDPGSAAQSEVVRMQRTGSLDTAFAGTGHEHFSGFYLTSAVQPDGKILIGGANLRRLNEDGSPDVTFGSSEQDPADGVLNVSAMALALMPDGYMLAAGRRGNGNYELRRPDAFGSADASFGFEGQAGLGGSSEDEFVEADSMAVTEHGVAVAGMHAIYDPDFGYHLTINIARFTNDPPIVSSIAHISQTGTLIIDATDDAENLELSLHNPQTIIMRQAQAAPQYFPVSRVRRIRATLNGGDDVLQSWLNIPTTMIGGAGDDSLNMTFAKGHNARGYLDGGDGNDEISGSSIDLFGGGDCTILGGAGNDYVFGGTGDDLIDGGDGNDHLLGWFGSNTVRGGAGRDVLEGGTGTDEFFGGNGRDAVDYGQHGGRIGGGGNPLPLVLSIDGLANDGVPGERDNIAIDIENIIGGRVADRIIGSSRDNFLVGGPGDDTIEAGAGDDTVEGGEGADLLSGNAGSDWVDYSKRTAGVVVVLSRFRKESGEKGEGDQIAPSIENVIGGSNRDYLVGSTGDNILQGRGGRDTLIGLGGRDALFGGAGNDRLGAGDGNDYLEGGSGNDTMDGGLGNDTLMGQSGSDLLLGLDDAADRLEGGSGRDRAMRDLLDLLVSIQQVLQ